MFCFVFLCLWRKAVANLEHEQNELYFAEKSLRLSIDKQHNRTASESKTQRTTSTTSTINPPPLSDTSFDSVFTVDQTTDVKSPISRTCSTERPETPSAPLVSRGSNIFNYPPEAYRHEYLELI